MTGTVIGGIAIVTALLGAQSGGSAAQTRPSDDRVISPSQAASLVGSKRTVCGRVLDTSTSPPGGPLNTITLQDDGAALVVMLAPAERKSFTPLFHRLMAGREVCIEAKIEKADTRLELRVRDIDQIKFIGPPAHPNVFAPGVDRRAATQGPRAGISDPSPVRSPAPRYTPMAMKAKIQGDVEIDVLISASGDVTEIQLAKSLDPLLGLDEEAVTAALKWKFTPAVKAGQPVPFIARLVLSFRLH